MRSVYLIQLTTCDIHYEMSSLNSVSVLCWHILRGNELVQLAPCANQNNEVNILCPTGGLWHALRGQCIQFRERPVTCIMRSVQTVQREPCDMHSLWGQWTVFNRRPVICVMRSVQSTQIAPSDMHYEVSADNSDSRDMHYEISAINSASAQWHALWGQCYQFR